MQKLWTIQDWQKAYQNQSIQLTDLIDDKNQVWEIHTSYPRNKFNKNQKLLWER